MVNLVECYSGLEYADTPVAIYWEEQRLEVSEVMASWRTPRGKGFRVKTVGDQEFELFYDEVLEAWNVLRLS